MADLLDPADYISIAKAAKLIPGRPHIATLWRWTTHGANGVILRTQFIGGRRFTTERWLEDFLTDCDAASAKRRQQEVRPVASSRDAAAASAKAQRELAAKGF